MNVIRFKNKDDVFSPAYGPFFGSTKSLLIVNRAISFEPYQNPMAEEWRNMMVIAPVKHDAAGGLLPLQSYDETIRRGMSFLLDVHLMWFKESRESLVDEKGVVLYLFDFIGKNEGATATAFPKGREI